MRPLARVLKLLITLSTAVLKSYKRLQNYLKRNGWNNYHEFMDVVERDKTGTQEKILVNFLTTNHTYFMREFEHFDYFRSEVLPWLKTKEAASKDLRIWCGAASTGEEPYMIAMVLADFFGLEKDQWDKKILATDISTKVLQQAMLGIYSAEQLKNLPEQWKSTEILCSSSSVIIIFPFPRKKDLV